MFLLNITALGIRLSGLYVLMKAYFYQRGLNDLQYQISNDYGELPSVLSAQTVVMLVIAAVLVTFPVSIARILLPKTIVPSPSLADGADALEVCAYSAIGIFLAATALPEIFQGIMYIVVSKLDAVSTSSDMLKRLYSSLGAAIFQISVGAYLVLGAPKIAVLLKKLRGRW